MASESEIQTLADKIAREFHPEKIILFGSHARGCPARFRCRSFGDHGLRSASVVHRCGDHLSRASSALPARSHRPQPSDGPHEVTDERLVHARCDARRTRPLCGLTQQSGSPLPIPMGEKGRAIDLNRLGSSVKANSRKEFGSAVMPCAAPV